MIQTDIVKVTVVLSELSFIGSDYSFQMFDNLSDASKWVDSIVIQAIKLIQ